MCPLHALGTMMVVRDSIDTNLFPFISEGQESNYVNKILLNIYKKWEKERSEGRNVPYDFQQYTSHAQRHGAAEAANEHPDILTQWLIPRGAWTLEQLQTIFTYIAGTAKEDAKVGRVLAGWPSADHGGYCPGKRQMGFVSMQFAGRK
jgi:hypothetical protein